MMPAISVPSSVLARSIVRLATSASYRVLSAR